MDQLMPLPQRFSRWRHHHNGREYVVIAVANVTSTKPEQFPPTIVYQDINGETWSRPLASWYAKFKPIDPDKKPLCELVPADDRSLD